MGNGHSGFVISKQYQHPKVLRMGILYTLRSVQWDDHTLLEIGNCNVDHDVTHVYTCNIISVLTEYSLGVPQPRLYRVWISAIKVGSAFLQRIIKSNQWISKYADFKDLCFWAADSNLKFHQLIDLREVGSQVVWDFSVALCCWKPSWYAPQGSSWMKDLTGSLLENNSGILILLVIFECFCNIDSFLNYRLTWKCFLNYSLTCKRV